MFETEESLKAQMVKHLEGVVGCCEVTNYEKHMLWIEYSEEAMKAGCAQSNGFRRHSWEASCSGLFEVVGYLGDRPVAMSLWVDTIDGHRILFYEPTSRLVDYALIDEWLEANLPKTAYRADGSMNRSDAMNFCNILPWTPLP